VSYWHNKIFHIIKNNITSINKIPKDISPWSLIIPTLNNEEMLLKRENVYYDESGINEVLNFPLLKEALDNQLMPTKKDIELLSSMSLRENLYKLIDKKKIDQFFLTGLLENTTQAKIKVRI